MKDTRTASGRKNPSKRAAQAVSRRIEAYYQEAGRPFPWRNASATTFDRVITEILLQQTSATTVASFFPRFRSKYPSWRRLSRATVSELEQDLRAIGLWRRRARVLASLAKELHARGGRFPSRREEIEKLPAVGQYVANAVELFCFHRPRPLLDAGMARVIERCFGPRELADIRHDPYLQATSQYLVDEAKDPLAFNWGMLDVAGTVCRPRTPSCGNCPLQERCLYSISRASKK